MIDVTEKDCDGKIALELTTNPVIKELFAKRERKIASFLLEDQLKEKKDECAALHAENRDLAGKLKELEGFAVPSPNIFFAIQFGDSTNKNTQTGI